MNNAAPDKVAVATYTGAAFSSISIMPRSDGLQLLSLHTERWEPLLKSRSRSQSPKQPHLLTVDCWAGKDGSKGPAHYPCGSSPRQAGRRAFHAKASRFASRRRALLRTINPG